MELGQEFQANITNILDGRADPLQENFSAFVGYAEYLFGWTGFLVYAFMAYEAILFEPSK